jgi:hypothetical protein
MLQATASKGSLLRRGKGGRLEYKIYGNVRRKQYTRRHLGNQEMRKGNK